MLRIYESRQEKEVDTKRNETGKGRRQEKDGDRKRKKTGTGIFVYLSKICLELH